MCDTNTNHTTTEFQHSAHTNIAGSSKCIKCDHMATTPIHMCHRCMDYKICMLDLHEFYNYQELFRITGINPPITPNMARYKLKRPQKTVVKLHCLIYELLFKRNYTFNYDRSAIDKFNIVQTRCHTEKYVFCEKKIYKHIETLLLVIGPFLAAMVVNNIPNKKIAVPMSMFYGYFYSISFYRHR